MVVAFPLSSKCAEKRCVQHSRCPRRRRPMWRKVPWFVSGLALLALSVSVVSPVTLAATVIIVGQNAAQCPGAQFTTIQDAVNAASPGDSIQICPGTYVEQVSISKPLQLNGNNGAIIRPSNVTANSISVSSVQTIAALILANDTSDVTIRDVIIDGSDNA